MDRETDLEDNNWYDPILDKPIKKTFWGTVNTWIFVSFLVIGLCYLVHHRWINWLLVLWMLFILAYMLNHPLPPPHGKAK